MVASDEGSAAPGDNIPLTAAGQLVGTVRYMSPEQAAGEPVDGRTDVWSLAVVLYELATGRPPFHKGSVIATVVDITSSEPVPLADLIPNVPEELSRVVERAMRKDRNDRFATAGEMADALREVSEAFLQDGNAGVAVSSGTAQETAAGTLMHGSNRSGADGRPTAIQGLSVPGAPTTYLGRRRSRLIGRERELSDIIATLRSPNEQLVTLTGPGGTGKTRLAVEAGYELRDAPDFPDGVHFVDLSPLSDPATIAGAIARSLGVPDVQGSSLVELLQREVAHKTMLLVLDNFEHVLEGATLISELIAASPGLKVLATSRAPLRLSEEREYPVEPLEVPGSMTLPPLEELARVPAVALFVERARQAKSAFELTAENARAVAEVCRKLEGLPLALELAAARIKLLTPAAMLDRLDHRLKLLTGGARDLPGRQQTMRGAVAWS
jgi:hypothetical protein